METPSDCSDFHPTWDEDFSTTDQHDNSPSGPPGVEFRMEDDIEPELPVASIATHPRQRPQACMANVTEESEQDTDPARLYDDGHEGDVMPDCPAQPRILEALADCLFGDNREVLEFEEAAIPPVEHVDPSEISRSAVELALGGVSVRNIHFWAKGDAEALPRIRTRTCGYRPVQADLR